ncbi:O-antigen ligase family protein, partial [candidate division WOR-3 bacterium]|nr:O-antigen ligase family protein [candidate division WOR-3 bacterium]
MNQAPAVPSGRETQLTSMRQQPTVARSLPRSTLLLGLPLLALAGACWLWLGNSAALALLGCGAAAVLAFHPGVTLALFLTAGTFKAELEPVLPAGLDLTVALGGLLIAGIVLRALRSGVRSVLPRGRLLVPFLAFCFVVALSALSDSANLYGREKALRFLTLTSLAFLAVPAAISSEPRRDAAAGAPFADRGFRQFLLTSVLIGILMVTLGRVTGEGLRAFGATHIATGRVVGLGLIGTCYMLLRPGRRMPARLPWLAVSALLAGGFLYSGSRGSMVALLGTGVITMLVSLSLRHGRRWVLALAGLLVLIGVTVALVAPEAVETMNRRFTHTLSGPLTVTARTRTDRAVAALEQFAEHPVAGAGIGAFDMLSGYGDTGRGDYPHNLLLEVVAELGIFGLAALLLLLFAVLREVLGSLRQSPATGAPAVGAGTAVFAIGTYFLLNAL